MRLDKQQYTAWSDCTDVLADFVLYWWKKLIPLSSSWIRVKVRDDLSVFTIIAKYITSIETEDVTFRNLTNLIEMNMLNICFKIGVKIHTKRF